MRSQIGLARLSTVAAIFVGWAFAQSGPNGKPIYFLKDDVHGEWCGYANESRFKDQIQPLRAMVLGKLEYTNGHVAAVHVTQVDETGDWAVNDEYALDRNEKIQTLKRTINILPEDTSEEQLFAVENGKANRQRSTSRELNSGKPTQKRVDWFEPPPVVTSLAAFPFSALIVEKQQTIRSRGEVCIPDSPK